MLLSAGAGDKIAKGKPAPDAFLTAAAGYTPVPQPQRCLVFEDAPVGVTAGKAAGMCGPPALPEYIKI